MGCTGGLLFLIDILILVSNRTRGKNFKKNKQILFKRNPFVSDLVQQWKACIIVTIITIIIEIGLMIGLILCIAYCSGYISMISTSLDKGR